MLTPEQIAARKQGIGASETVILFPEIPNPYSTPYQLWMEKTGRLERKQELNDFQWWGHKLEPAIAERYEYETGEKLEYRSNTVIHPRLSFMVCHPDRYVVGKRKLAEIKAVSYDPDKWGEAGTDHVPPEYILQVQHQLACTEYEEADLIAFFLNYRKTVIYHFKRDNELISLIESAISKFWNNNVLADVPPELVGISDFKLKFKKNNLEYVQATPEIIALLKELKSIRGAKDILEEKENDALLPIYKVIGDKLGITNDNGSHLATWLFDKSGKRRFSLKEKLL